MPIGTERRTMAKSRKNHQRSWQSRPLKILPLNTSASIPEEELKKIYESIIFWGGGAFVQDYLGKVSLEQVRNGLEFHKDGKDSVWKYSLDGVELTVKRWNGAYFANPVSC